MLNEKLVSWLFATKAIQVSPMGSPFWYTSGTIGPYYINTHFLYGSEKKAGNLLELIDREKDSIYSCPSRVLDAERGNYKKDPIYRGLIDEICNFIRTNLDIDSIDYISGGERRDWFFSLITADKLEKPHITIYKSLDTVYDGSDGTNGNSGLNQKKVLHIADLITEASSYERAWIPAIRRSGGVIDRSLAVVDRKQGGREFLESECIKLYSMVCVDRDMFSKALEMKLIDRAQYMFICDYMNDPLNTMREFLKENPAFLENSLNSDEKTRERARLCLQKDIYRLGGIFSRQ